MSSGTALLRASGGDGHLSPSHATTCQESSGVSSFMLTHTSANGVCMILLPTGGAGPALLGMAADGAQGQLSHPTLTNSLLALPPALGIQWWGAWRGYCSPAHAATGRSSNGDSSPVVTTLTLAHPHCHQPTGMALLCCPGEEHGLVSKHGS